MRITRLILCIFLLSCSNDTDKNIQKSNDNITYDLPKEYVYKNIEFSDNLALVAIQADKKYPLQAGAPLLHGYIDKKKKLVIQFKYNQASNFKNGLALVQDKDQYYYIDNKGNKTVPLFQFSSKLSIDNWYHTNEKLFVINPNGIQLLKSPDNNSEVIENINYSDEVVVKEIPENRQLANFNDLTGYFAFVEVKGLKGYIFDTYLSKYKPPKKNNKNIYEFMKEEKIKDQRSLSASYSDNGLNISVLSSDIIIIQEFEGTGDWIKIYIANVNFQQGFLLAKLIFPELLKNEKIPETEAFTKHEESNKGIEDIRMTFNKNNYFVITYGNGM